MRSTHSSRLSTRPNPIVLCVVAVHKKGHSALVAFTGPLHGSLEQKRPGSPGCGLLVFTCNCDKQFNATFSIFKELPEPAFQFCEEVTPCL